MQLPGSTGTRFVLAGLGLCALSVAYFYLLDRLLFSSVHFSPIFRFLLTDIRRRKAAWLVLGIMYFAPRSGIGPPCLAFGGLPRKPSPFIGVGKHFHAALGISGRLRLPRISPVDGRIRSDLSIENLRFRSTSLRNCGPTSLIGSWCEVSMAPFSSHHLKPVEP